MNFNKAKKEYQKTEISSNATKSAMELVEIMAKELNKSMGIVVNCLRNKEISKKRSKHFSRALMIIYTLQTTLDFDKGEDLAVKLFQFYEFCRKQLIKGVTQNIPDCVSKAIDTINQVFNECSIKFL